MKEFLSQFVYMAFYLVSRLPYSTLYVLSDCLYPLLYHVARYRRNVVRRNLTTSFPELTERELLALEQNFYHWLCDYCVETVKLMSVSRAELLRHVEFRGVEQIEECFYRGQTCAAILGHCCNWELLSATGQVFRTHKEAVCGLIYHPLSSPLFDRMFIKIRQGMGGVCIPKQDTLRYLESFRRQGLMNLFGYVADQMPREADIHLWLDFLGHETPVLTGAERLMRRMENAVFYVDMERPQRGRYVFTFKPITMTPASEPEFFITKRFFAMLEQTVRRNPALYLWSHDRWRLTHSDFDREYRTEHGHVVKRQETNH